jgi:hypothetical protein
VITRVDLRFVDESTAVALRFRCDDCAHFDDAHERCSHGYPTAPHRPAVVEPGTDIVFCKDFDLGGSAP